MSAQSKDVFSSGTPDGIVAVMGSLPSLPLLVLMHALGLVSTKLPSFRRHNTRWPTVR